MIGRVALLVTLNKTKTTSADTRLYTRLIHHHYYYYYYYYSYLYQTSKNCEEVKVTNEKAPPKRKGYTILKSIYPLRTSTPYWVVRCC